MRADREQFGLGGLLPLWALRGFLAPHRAVMLLTLLALLGAVAATLALPVGIRSLVEADGTGSRVFLALAAIALLLAVCSALRYYLVTWLGERVGTELRKKLYGTVLGMGPSFHLRHPGGELLSTLGNDALLVQNVLTSMVPVTLRNLLLLVGSLIMMLVSSPVQGMQVLLLVPIVVTPIILLGRRVRGFSRLSQDCLARSSGFASETLAGLQTIQALQPGAALHRTLCQPQRTRLPCGPGAQSLPRPADRTGHPAGCHSRARGAVERGARGGCRGHERGRSRAIPAVCRAADRCHRRDQRGMGGTAAGGGGCRTSAIPVACPT